MLVTLLVMAAACVVQTTAQCLSVQDARPMRDKDALRELERSHLHFSLNLFKAVAELQPQDNVFISPVSIYNALLLAFFTSAGHTEESLQKLLFGTKYQDKSDMLVSYRLKKYTSGEGGYSSQVNSANRLFVSKNQKVLDCMESLFEDEIEYLDFSARGLQHAVERINLWVANKTRDNIQDLVSANDISPRTQLILANAAYFKGVWKNQFDSLDTRMGEFQVNKHKTVQVPMMFQQNSFSHWRSNQLAAEILELPYKGDEVSFILLLPDASSDESPAASLLRGLDRKTLLTLIKESTDPKNEDKVEVRLPKFITEKTLELTSILEGLGVGDLFQPTSNLTTLLGRGPRVYFNSAIHKAKIQVDERGTEAAAVTALTDTRIPANTFNCDRPFVYLLYDKKNRLLLFAGIFNDPTK